jgi:hypothetical protein
MINIKINVLTFVLVCSTLNGQDYDFGKVSVEELTEKVYPLDNDANAAVLFRYQNAYYSSGNLVTEVRERIKIYSKGGFDHATEFINLYDGRTSQESVGRIKAFTYNLDNGKIVTSELDKEQIFKSQLSYNYKQVKFTMPNVKEGSVVEFSYKVTSPFIWNLDDFRFQRDIPVKQIEAEIRTPKGFNFKKTHRGYFPFRPKVETKRDARVDMEMEVSTYKLSNIPALKDEPLVDNMNNYRAGVMFELVSIDLPGVLSKTYATTWEDVAESIGSSTDYKKELDKTKSFDDDLDLLIAGESDKLNKTKVLFKHVKENTEWNGVDGKYFQYGLKKTLKEKIGNTADINLLLVAMLRYAGIDANPVVLSTKDNSIPFFPTLERLNYVIAHAKIDGKEYYMDATDEFSDINILPIKDYNWGGLLIDNNKEVWKHIYSIKPKKAMNRYSLTANINADGSMSGEYMARFSNHSAYVFRNQTKDVDEETRITNRESKFSGAEIDAYALKNIDTYEGSIVESFDYEVENGVDIIGDKMFLTPTLFLKTEENPFKLEKREFPVDFGFPVNDKYRFEISIPEGYVVESLPKPIVMSLPEELGKFKYVIDNKNEKIALSITFDLNKAIISAVHYGALKEYFNQIIIKEAEQVVLSKITDGTTDSSEKGR